MKVPAMLAIGIICLALGFGAGAVTIAFTGNPFEKKQEVADATPKPEDEERKEGDPAAKQGGPGGRRGRGPGGPGAGPGGPGVGPGGPGAGPGGPGAGFPGFGRPSSKGQLAALVTKLDQLTAKPLSISLNDEKRGKLKEQLKGLGDLETLDEDEAKKRMEAIVEIVKDDKETLEAAGYRFPGQRGGAGGAGFGPRKDVPNPFKEEAGGKHLKSLEETLGKSGK